MLEQSQEELVSTNPTWKDNVAIRTDQWGLKYHKQESNYNYSTKKAALIITLYSSDRHLDSYQYYISIK